MKKWYESKTIWFNALTLAAVAIDAAVGSGAITQPKVIAWTVVFTTVINAALRVVTSQPIKHPKK